jgi:hypothetical protein
VAEGLDPFLARYGAQHDLVPEAAVPIADFGVGADSPILLDYRGDVLNLNVINLEWTEGGGPNFWVELAPDFPSFVEMLGL